jgi:hypothetical protein
MIASFLNISVSKSILLMRKVVLDVSLFYKEISRVNNIPKNKSTSYLKSEVKYLITNPRQGPRGHVTFIAMLLSIYLRLTNKGS